LRIIIENFKSLKRIEMELADVTVLIGPPASGKSNILDAIAFAGYFHRFRVLAEEYGNNAYFLEPLMSIARFSDPRNLFPFYDISQDIVISVTGEANVRCIAKFECGSVKVYVNDVEVPWNIGTSPAVTRTDVVDAVKSANALFEARLYSYDRYGLGVQSCDTKSCGFGHLVSNAVYARQYPVNILNDLGWNATYILLRSPHIVSDINKEFAEGCNEKVEIHVLRSGEARIFDKEYEMPRNVLSDGSLRALYILLALSSAINYAKVHGLEKRLIILLEEPESHIYPFLLRLLVNYIKKASQKVCIVISTHNQLLSTAIRNEVKNFRAYYVYRDENDYTNIAELDMDKMAKDLITFEDIMSRNPNNVLREYVLKRL
jgi:ABC-type polar amino acid transport system ATPase subunit